MSLVLRCPGCQSLNLQIGAGSGPHYARLTCGNCNRHIRWLKPHQAKAFQNHLPSIEQTQPNQLSLFGGVD